MPILDNQRWENFCQLLSQCPAPSAKDAYIQAGYKSKGHSAEVRGSDLLRNVEVAARLAELKAEAAKRNDISIDWVLRGLKANAERAMQAVPVLDKEGNETGEFRYEGAVANRAYELIGKHLGMFDERKGEEGSESEAMKAYDSQLAQAWRASSPAK